MTIITYFWLKSIISLKKVPLMTNNTLMQTIGFVKYFNIYNLCNHLSKITTGNICCLHEKHILQLLFPPRQQNTRLVSSGTSLTSWGEGASLALVGHPSSDDVTIKIWGRSFTTSTSSAPHLFLLVW